MESTYAQNISHIYWYKIMQIQKCLSIIKHKIKVSDDAKLTDVYNILLDYRYECIKQLATEPMLKEHDVINEIIKGFSNTS